MTKIPHSRSCFVYFISGSGAIISCSGAGNVNVCLEQLYRALEQEMYMCVWQVLLNPIEIHVKMATSKKLKMHKNY